MSDCVWDKKVYEAGEFARFIHNEIDMAERQYKLTDFSFDSGAAWFVLQYPDGVSFRYVMTAMRWKDGDEFPCGFTLLRNEIYPCGKVWTDARGQYKLAHDAFEALAAWVNEHECAFTDGVIYAERKAQDRINFIKAQGETS